MASGGDLKWNDAEIFHPEQIESILITLNINITNETEDSFLCLCPFHSNSDSAALSVDKNSGLYLCFNPHCGERGTVQTLVEQVGHLNFFQAKRLINKYKQNVDMAAIVARNLVEPVEFVRFSQETITHCENNLWAPEYPEGLNYLQGRGFKLETLRHFEVGYSLNQGMTVVPMHDPDGMPIGFIGRSVKGKSFKNSPGLPKSKTPFNLHRAKRASSTVIVCESSFDAMRVHQAGFENVVALLGGFISSHHVNLLGKSFDTVINFVDADEAGRTLGSSIAKKMEHKRILWAAHSPEELYPHGAKDASDLTDKEIQNLVRNARHSIEYEEWYN